jgi:hypothetical protein
MPLRAAQQAVSTSSGDSEVVPQGCSRYSISIKKPLGLVLEQNKDTGVIVVAEIAPEGNAAKTGLVAVVSLPGSPARSLPFLGSCVVVVVELLLNRGHRTSTAMLQRTNHKRTHMLPHMRRTQSNAQRRATSWWPPAA